MTRRLAVEILMVAGLAFALGLIGPFGTYSLPAGARMAYWLVFGLAGYAIFRPLIIAGGWVAEALNIPRFAGIGLALLVAAVPMTMLVSMLLWGFDLKAALTSEGLPLLYAQVWLIGFLTNGFFMLVFPRDANALALQDDGQAPPPPPQTPSNGIGPDQPANTGLQSRLPPGFGPVLALKGEDHYVRVIGETRSELILIRLRDAVASMPDGDGAQVHRSWWVAQAGVSSIRRTGREAEIILVDGTSVPVSRDGVALIRKLGWV